MGTESMVLFVLSGCRLLGAIVASCSNAVFYVDTMGLCFPVMFHNLTYTLAASDCFGQ